MTHTETEKPKALTAVVYSHSGQTASCLEHLLGGLKEFGWVTNTYHIQSEGRRPFPWTCRSFLGEFVSTVQGEFERCFLVPDLPRGSGAAGSLGGVIVLCTPVWFLTLPRPVASFLQGDRAGIFRGRRVICLFTCRNMWQNAALAAVSRLEALGAASVACVAITDRTKSMVSLVNTPAWLLTGRRKPSFLPEVGVDPLSMQRAVATVARMLDGDSSSSRAELPLDMRLDNDANAVIRLSHHLEPPLHSWFFSEWAGAHIWRRLSQISRALMSLQWVPGFVPLLFSAVGMIVAILVLVPPFRLAGAPLFSTACRLFPPVRRRAARLMQASGWLGAQESAADASEEQAAMSKGVLAFDERGLVSTAPSVRED